MSEYYESLYIIEKARYIAKLEAVGFILEYIKYSKESRRILDRNKTSWPVLEYGHIFGYFITHPGF